jgi:phosphatidylserine decarboxylase
MLLSPYGLREWLTITVIALVLGAAAAWFGWWWAVAVVAVLWFAGVAFFRDPRRHGPDDLEPGAMISPADGAVRSVLRVDHHEAVGGPAVVIRIFLSVLNVHINRSPCDGEVVDITYKPGKFLDARKEISAKVNESNLVVLRTESGETIGVRQISGAIARRIVCAIETGDHLKRGERYGMIKFGSTTELILPRPDDVQVRVKPGDKVKAGRDVLAIL